MPSHPMQATQAWSHNGLTRETMPSSQQQKQNIQPANPAHHSYPYKQTGLLYGSTTGLYIATDVSQGTAIWNMS